MHFLQRNEQWSLIHDASSPQHHRNRDCKQRKHDAFKSSQAQSSFYCTTWPPGCKYFSSFVHQSSMGQVLFELQHSQQKSSVAPTPNTNQYLALSHAESHLCTYRGIWCSQYAGNILPAKFAYLYTFYELTDEVLSGPVTSQTCHQIAFWHTYMQEIHQSTLHQHTGVIAWRQTLPSKCTPAMISLTSRLASSAANHTGA